MGGEASLTGVSSSRGRSTDAGSREIDGSEQGLLTLQKVSLKGFQIVNSQTLFQQRNF